MKKAVLVIDMPEHCYECPCFMNEGWRCQCRLDINEEVHDERPTWCPLRPLPEKWERKPYNSDSRVDWQNGYNRCLDDIQGIEDKNERENQWWAEHSSRFD